MQWDLLRLKQPLQIEPDGRKICILFRDRFEALKSMAL